MMEMQDQVTRNDMMCDESHDVKSDNEEGDYRGPMTRARTRVQKQSKEGEDEKFENEREDSDNVEEGLPILIHVKRFEGGPVMGSLMQKELVGEIVNGCVQDYPISIDALNEFECVITMPKKLTASLVAQEIQHMTHWREYKQIFSVL